ncbi:hypothetical protein SCE1572_03340 [Sorangium cellulosum So0157-2]|uniref:Uncharacterized protein n=1 Tax=Sorangium cellulosum So0157-2 TaxID=1254432 RepID=S4XP65_SORCE|nr:hypothetical protein SCE1572_03340 [Sorangium cellulosum So0157-2]
MSRQCDACREATPASQGAQGVARRLLGRRAEAAGADAAPRAEHGLLREVVEIGGENAPGAQRGADERAVREERGGVEMDGGVRWLAMGPGRAGEPAANGGTQVAARGRIDLLALFGARTYCFHVGPRSCGVRPRSPDGCRRRGQHFVAGHP